MTLDDESPTPRILSPSVGQWPVYRKLAVDLAASARAEAERLADLAWESGEFGTGSAMFCHVPELRSIVSDAFALSGAFSAWEFRDPGGDLRQLAISKLLDLRARAGELGVYSSTYRKRLC